MDPSLLIHIHVNVSSTFSESNRKVIRSKYQHVETMFVAFDPRSVKRIFEREQRHLKEETRGQKLIAFDHQVDLSPDRKRFSKQKEL